MQYSPSAYSLHERFGLLELDVDQFAGDILFWFNCQQHDEMTLRVQTEVLIDSVGELFVRPVSSRWLSLGPVCLRLIDQFPALLKYFLEVLPKGANSSALCKGDRYKRIRPSLEDKFTIDHLNFIACIASTLTGFVKLFQTDAPMIHVLFDKVNELVHLIMFRF